MKQCEQMETKQQEGKENNNIIKNQTNSHVSQIILRIKLLKGTSNCMFDAFLHVSRLSFLFISVTCIKVDCATLNLNRM
jgi:hypothetical protein